MADPRDGRLAAHPIGTPGPLGRGDAADPDVAGATGGLAPPTPGPLGRHDAADPSSDGAPDPRIEDELDRHAASERAVLERINAFIDEAFRQDEQVHETLEGLPPGERGQARADLGLPPAGDVFDAPSKYLGRALALATAARKGHSLDPILRDAQYYFHTRSRVASTPAPLRPFTAMGGGFASTFWDFAKWVLPESVESFLMRTDPGNPNSPPGGWMWGLVGCSDGLLDHMPERGKPRYAKSTPREELRSLVQGFQGAAVYAAPR